MKRLSRHFRRVGDGGKRAGARLRPGPGGEKEKQMFLRSRKAVAVATLSLVLPLSSSAFISRKATNAPQAVEFSLRSIDGQTVSSTSLHGEAAVLPSGASWLPLSRTPPQGGAKRGRQ